MVFKMTAFDVAVGDLHKPYSCPIAQAMSRKLNRTVRVWRDKAWVNLASRGADHNLWGVSCEVELPPNVTEFIRMTDLGLMPKPITFVLELEEPFTKAVRYWGFNFSL